MTTDHVVRGHWLIGGAKFLRTHYAPDTSDRLLGSLSKSLRAMLADIQPVQWYSRGYHVEILNAVVSAHRDEAGARDSLLAYGQQVAFDLAHAPLAPLIRILTPKLLAKKLPNLWASDHREDGRLETDIAHIDDARLVLRLSALGDYEHVGVASLGWIKGFLMSLGPREVVVTQTGWRLAQPTPNEMSCEVRWS